MNSDLVLSFFSWCVQVWVCVRFVKIFIRKSVIIFFVYACEQCSSSSLLFMHMVCASTQRSLAFSGWSPSFLFFFGKTKAQHTIFSLSIAFIFCFVFISFASWNGAWEQKTAWFHNKNKFLHWYISIIRWVGFDWP